MTVLKNKSVFSCKNPRIRGGYTSGNAKELVIKQFTEDKFKFTHVIK